MARQINGISDIWEHLDADGNYVDKRRMKKRTEKRVPTPAQQDRYNRFAAASRFSHAIMTTDIKKFWTVRYMTEANFFMKQNMNAFNSKGEIEDYSLFRMSPNESSWHCNMICIIRDKTMSIHWKCFNFYKTGNKVFALVFIKGDKSHEFRMECIGNYKDEEAQLDISKYKSGTTLEIFILCTKEKKNREIMNTHIEIKL